jgi:hypothetical protein
MTFEEIQNCLGANVRSQLELKTTLRTRTGEVFGMPYWFRTRSVKTRVIRVEARGKQMYLKLTASGNFEEKNPASDAPFDDGPNQLLAIVRGQIDIVRRQVFGEA